MEATSTAATRLPGESCFPEKYARGLLGRVRELALVFLRLGTTAFGGPAAHLAMMDHEFVRRRAWLTREQFLDLVGAAGLIPGPSSTEVAIYIGYRRAGWRGLIVAGVCFILPAAILVTAIGWAYVRFGRLPAAEGVLYGIKAAIIAVILQAVVGLARTAIKTKWIFALGVLAALASALGASPIVVLLVSGFAASIPRWIRRSDTSSALLVGPGLLAVPTAVASSVSLVTLLLVFLKFGAVVFGSGYVLLAFLRADLVDRLHWLTEAQLIDAVAVGQFTPGPVFTTATFVGYVVAGLPGAVLATVGIFLPSFVLVAASAQLIRRVRESPTASSFLDGVNVASLALMMVVSVALARAAIVDLPTALLAVASLVVLLRWRVNSAWLVLLGGVVGAVVHRQP